MKPAWDAVSAEVGSSTVIMADVDCTEHEAVCSKHGVKGYPTIKYFTAETGPEGKDYQGGRSEADLRKFVAEELQAQCQVADPSGCDDKEKAYIEKFTAKGADAAKKELTRLQSMNAAHLAPATRKWLGQRINILNQM